MRRYELDMILEVTEPGEELKTSVIADRIEERFGVRMSNQKIGVRIGWDLNTIFKKTIYPGRAYTFTRLVEAGGVR